MYAARKLVRQRRVDHAMTLQPALPAEGLRHDIQPEMSSAARTVSGVAFVPMRLVLDTQAFGRESLSQLSGDEILRLHPGKPSRQHGVKLNERAVLICRLSSLEGVGHALA